MSGRRPADWMCPLDERIMEYIEREDWATPRLIHSETSMNASWGRTYERLKMLEQAGLVEREHHRGTMFDLTGEGIRYLRGDLDAEHLPCPNPHTV
jgi:predicted transcriptional regulator